MKQQLAVLMGVLSFASVYSQTVQSCDSLVYCQGSLLDKVELARIYNDSKTFVDLPQINSSAVTLANWQALLASTSNNPSKSEIQAFVEANFNTKESELEDWTPSDYTSSPKILSEITDAVVKNFTKSLVSIWPTLGKKIKSSVSTYPDRHSLIAVPNGFIIPGGRFKEIYYWDSYWIMKGLLISDMPETVRGMLENFLHLVAKYGFVPNGSRVYYLNRSQPPLLALMAGLYVDATNNVAWLRQHVDTLEKELNWWLENRSVTIRNGLSIHTLAHYASPSGTPRPESYYEDIKTCAFFTNETEKESCYKNLKSGAESGWDFSSRWIFDSEGGDNANLSHVQTPRVIPVELNAFLCKAFKELSKLYLRVGNLVKFTYWDVKHLEWRRSISTVLYDDDAGIWFDYDLTLGKHRKHFYPSNFAPLWTDAYDILFRDLYGSKAAAYFNANNISQFQGGIPTSLEQSGEQWDLPNAWPPLQEIVILGLKNTGNTEAVNIAKTFAKRWIDANIKGYNANQVMFEKYDAIVSGQFGGGGEYTVQAGFGWTNGVVLSLIKEYYTN